MSSNVKSVIHPIIEKLHVKDIYTDLEFRGALLDYAGKTLISENVDFLLKLNELEHSENLSDTRKIEKYKELCSEFVLAGSLREINLPAQIRKAITDSIEKNNINIDALNPAKEEIEKMMENDVLPRFRDGTKGARTGGEDAKIIAQNFIDKRVEKYEKDILKDKLSSEKVSDIKDIISRQVKATGGDTFATDLPTSEAIDQYITRKTTESKGKRGSFLGSMQYMFKSTEHEGTNKANLIKLKTSLDNFSRTQPVNYQSIAKVRDAYKTAVDARKKQGGVMGDFWGKLEEDYNKINGVIKTIDQEATQKLNSKQDVTIKPDKQKPTRPTPKLT